VSGQEELPQNGHELSIDLGLHNLMTCYDSGNGKTFILGRKYLALERYFHKEIARNRKGAGPVVWAAVRKGSKTSGHIKTYQEVI
ncbi:transposase, partial [Blautia wexlerae]|uniref:transposase n=1 Tax=Blautia wexlerae TaxID=418240 RepID=UPI002ED5CADB